MAMKKSAPKKSPAKTATIARNDRVSVRAIENGFVVSHSHTDPRTGQFTEREVFSKTNPLKIPK